MSHTPLLDGNSKFPVLEEENKENIQSQIKRLRSFDYYLSLGWWSSNNFYFHGRISKISYNDIYYRKHVDFMFRKKIKFLNSFIKEAHLLTEDAEVYRWHTRSHKEGETELWSDRFLITYHLCLYDLSNTRFVKVATKNNKFIALTDNGEVYYYDKKYHYNTYGYRKDKFKLIQVNFKEKVIGVACSNDFYVVCDNGKVYNWGYHLCNKFKYDGHDGHCGCLKNYLRYPREVVGLLGKAIVKVVCGKQHTLALTDEGKVYVWGKNHYWQLNLSHTYKVVSPVMLQIPEIRKVSDIAAMKNMSAIKSHEDGLVRIWGDIFGLQLRKFTAVCEYTNIFDVCNTTCGQSPVSVEHIRTDAEHSILDDLEAAFNDHSTSDLTIEVAEKTIYVHKAILKIRSTYFRSMFQDNWAENTQSVMKIRHYSYIVYKAFLKYLYTGGVINLSLEDKLDLLRLADEYCERNLERDCIKMIKKEITVSNVLLIYETAIKYNTDLLEEHCLKFCMKRIKDVMKKKSFTRLDRDKKKFFLEQFFYCTIHSERENASCEINK